MTAQAAQPLSPGPASPLEEIRALVVGELPPLLDPAPAPAGLGDLTALRLWLSQAGKPPVLRHPRIALFFAPHGEDDARLQAVLDSLTDGSHPATALVAEANTDLQAYELAMTQGTFSAAEAPKALAYGMMAVQPGIDLLVLAAAHPAAAHAAEKIEAALEGGAEPFEAMITHGAPDIAAMAGAIVAARLARVPVLLEGRGAEASARIVAGLNPAAAAHTRSVSALIAEKTALPVPCRSALLIPLLASVAAFKG